MSVITVQRAYDDLEHEGLVQARRGKGFWVVSMPVEGKRMLAKKRFVGALKKVVAHGAAEGLGDDDMRRILEELLQKGTRK